MIQGCLFLRLLLQLLLGELELRLKTSSKGSCGLSTGRPKRDNMLSVGLVVSVTAHNYLPTFSNQRIIQGTVRPVC